MVKQNVNMPDPPLFFYLSMGKKIEPLKSFIILSP